MDITCKLVSGSIFWTGPVVLHGKETEALWFGSIGKTFKGSEGIMPNLAANTKIIEYKYSNEKHTNSNWTEWQIAKFVEVIYWRRSC